MGDILFDFQLHQGGYQKVAQKMWSHSKQFPKCGRPKSFSFAFPIISALPTETKSIYSGVIKKSSLDSLLPRSPCIGLFFGGPSEVVLKTMPGAKERQHRPLVTQGQPLWCSGSFPGQLGRNIARMEITPLEPLTVKWL